MDRPKSLDEGLSALARHLTTRSHLAGLAFGGPPGLGVTSRNFRGGGRFARHSHNVARLDAAG